MTATTAEIQHRAAPRVIALSSAVDFDELIPGYPMPRWQRGKYDRKSMKQHKVVKKPVFKGISLKIKATSLRIFGHPRAGVAAGPIR